jgi:hypothetical protein
MSFASLRAAIISRLDQSDRGDRGWWIVTRVHLTAGRLRTTASYLDDAGFRNPKEITEADYAALARVMETNAPDPGQGIRRHLFLAMETPLALIQRTDGRFWREIVLTPSGIELATAPDPVEVFQRILGDLVFCRLPWFTQGRVEEYHAFDIRPYETTLTVMQQCDGWIDRDEYDLFVSRIRIETETPWAVDGIQEFRTLSEPEKLTLLEEVKIRIPSPKSYSNWRDMGLHTFSLFSLGRSAIRVERQLILTELQVVPAPQAPPAELPAPPAPLPRSTRSVLQMPDVGDDDDLAAPPVAPAANVGTEAELLIGKMLSSDGWRVVYYSNRRWFGFDIWAHRDGKAALIEVKSSLGAASSISLTSMEHQAAATHGANYVLAIVENVGTEEPTIHMIVDPVANLEFRETQATEFTVSRTNWSTKVSPTLT